MKDRVLHLTRSFAALRRHRYVQGKTHTSVATYELFKGDVNSTITGKACLCCRFPWYCGIILLSKHSDAVPAELLKPRLIRALVMSDAGRGNK